jgi:hypothetical protein
MLESNRRWDGIELVIVLWFWGVTLECDHVGKRKYSCSNHCSFGSDITVPYAGV